MTLRHHGFALSDPGQCRDHNEDSVLIHDELGLYAVADGMGGHAAGEVASRMAIETLVEVISSERQTLELLRTEPSHESKLLGEKLVALAVQRACAQIHQEGHRSLQHRGMGTTLDCLMVAGNRVVLGHVGDSRSYLIRQGRVHRLTEDHTMTATAVRAGLMTPEEAAAVKHDSLTRAVGLHPSVQVDTLLIECEAGDRFLLCSDGLHGLLHEGEPASLFPTLHNEASLQSLIELANTRGGPDNVSVVLVSISGDARATLAQTSEDPLLALERSSLFYHFSAKERVTALSVAQFRDLSAGEVVFQEGSLGAEIYVVTHGSVAVDKSTQRLQELGVGAHFGEMILIEPTPRSATVRALEDSQVLVFHREALLALMRRDQSVAVKLLWNLVQALTIRLRVTSQGVVDARAELAAIHSRLGPPSAHVPFAPGTHDHG